MITRSGPGVVVSAYGAHEAWRDLLEELLNHGVEAKPRDKKTKEHVGLQLRIGHARLNIIANPLRVLNYRFLVGQWLATLAGMEEKNLERYNSQLSKFEDDGRGGKYPSYGPRLLPQWPYALKSLMDDVDTRQAIVSIWEAQRLETERYVPCTLSLQFLVRPKYEPFLQKEKEQPLVLNTIATMRSSDAWLGLPYDIYNFSQMANIVAAALSHAWRRPIDLGELIMNLGSSHLYENNWNQAAEIVKAPSGVYSVESPKLLPGLNTHLTGLQQLITQQPQPLEEKDWNWWPWPWRQYVQALEAKTSTAALEILRKIERREDA